MASPPRCSPTAQDMECKLPPPSAPASECRPGRLSWGTLARALGRFKLTIPRTHLLATVDPLALDREPPPQLLLEKHQVPEKLIWGDQEPLSKIPFKILSGHKHAVSTCHFCVDDTKLLSGSYDCTVKLWWKVRYDTFIVSCKFSPDGKYVVSGFDVDHGICIMDAENITTVSIIKDHHTRSITSCCFDPDSQRVASVSLDRCIKIWDVTSQATLLTITKAHSNAISNCCFTFSGHFLCTSSWDKNLKIWNVHTGEFRNRGACVTLMQGHEGSVSSCHFARDSSFLISGGFDRTVAIWDVAEGYRKLSLKGHNDWVMDVAISNNKKWILSASKDRTMRLWNIEEIDQIPLVIKYKKAVGLKLKQCERCDRPFSIFKSDTSSEMFTQCVFCRIDTRGLPADTSSSSSSERENSPPPRGSKDD
ncbi:WD repeat-containing protein 88 isoform X2 [Pongo abelii]|uniref:WD repeat-containing protein 88 isoform X2 n=1 Tax=Pongo abelii TaxID=9601 RepID=UPI0023E7EAE4|nr:WD repeat-containing protein 88 isoform X2 [Pongo abelii]